MNENSSCFCFCFGVFLCVVVFRASIVCWFFFCERCFSFGNLHNDLYVKLFVLSCRCFICFVRLVLGCVNVPLCPASLDVTCVKWQSECGTICLMLLLCSFCCCNV